MKRLVLLACLALVPHARSADDAPPIRFEELPAPTTAPGASGPSVVAGADGQIWLTWLEKTAGTTALRFSRFEAATKRWSAAATIASGPDWFVNAADFPALTAGPNGRAAAVWFVNNPAPPASSASTAATHDHHGPGYRAFISQTGDAGKTWSAPVPLTRESDSVEFVSLATLADGRVLAAWLDGRAKKRGGTQQQLFSRVLGANTPDVLVDEAVCDCCQTSLTAFPDGTALLTYRAHREGEVRDIHLTRFRGAAWDEPRPLNSDDWRIAGCPVNGPQIASDGGRVAAAWFTAADNDPRVVASFSPDAGARFLMPLRLTEKKTLGRVSTLLLHDGAMLLTFVDDDGGLSLRRVTPDFAAAQTVRLAEPAAGRIKGFPRLALLRDYAGGKEPAQFVAAFTQEGAAGVKTLLVSVPEGELLESEKSCDCAPTSEQLQGFPIRGTILAAPSTAGVLRVSHFDMPGIFAAGTRDFKVPPEMLAQAKEPGRQFLGRIEKRGDTWWLFDVRLIASAPKP